MNVSINLFTKCPYTGNPKTRLSTFFTKSERRFISEHLLNNMINEVRKLSLKSSCRNIYIYPDISKKFLNTFDSTDDFNLIKQRGDDLNTRMLNCIKDQARWSQKIILFGSDIPALTSEIIQDGIMKLDSHDAIIGPATDGGYYLIGFKDFPENYLQSINLQPESIRDSLSNKKIEFTELEVLSDIDHPADLLVI